MISTKAFLLFFLSIFFLNKSFSQNIYFDWAKQLDRRSGLSGEETYLIGVDAGKNVYLAGNFRNIMDLNPGPAVFNVSSTWDHVFVIKLDPAGNFVWGKNIGGDRFTLCKSLTVDNNGNVYLTGGFSGTTDFNPGTEVYNLTASAVTGQENYDIFTLKLDTDGNFKWAANAGGLNADIGNSVTIDPAGNVYTTGYFIGEVDFDPGAGTATVGKDGVKSTFISRFDSVGNFTWVKAFVGSFHNYGVCIKTDTKGNIYISGKFEGNIDFDPGAGIYNISVPFYSRTPFLVKLDTSGALVWVKKDIGGEGFEVDANQQVVSYGPTGFKGELSKFDVNGNALWTKTVGGRPGYLGTSSIRLDGANNIYLTGEFNYTQDFDPGSGVYNMTADGGGYSYDACITRLDANGSLVWAKQFGNWAEEHPTSIAVDTSGNVYTTGIYVFTVDFDPGPAVYDLTSFSGGGIFIHKMSRCSNVTYKTLNISACNSYTLNSTTYTQSGNYFQTMANQSGCDSIITLNLQIQNAETSIVATACDSFIWNNKVLNASGIYNDTLLSLAGCDSIVHLQLTVTKKALSDISVSVCEGEQYAGYTTSGTYKNTFKAANGCDSIRTLHLTVSSRKYATINAAVCEGDVFLGHSVSGVFTDTLVSNSGCDSIRTINLTIKPRLFTQLSQTICAGQAYLGYKVTGTYIDTFTALNGCDSIRRLNLFVTPKLSSTIEKFICIGETYLGHKSTGTYVDTLHTNAGCDSVVTTILKVQNKPAPYFNSNTEICLGDSIILNPGTFLSYKWQDNSTFKQFVVKKEGIYHVSVTNSCGSANAAVVIKNRMCQYSFPTAFTPNNDGKNDRFKILNAFNLKKFSLSIYNRYGQKVFETNDYSIGWDGIYQGLPGDTGVYVWYCSFEEAGVQSKIKGTIVLLR